VLALVADQSSDVDARLGVLCSAEAPRTEPKNLRMRNMTASRAGAWSIMYRTPARIASRVGSESRATGGSNGCRFTWKKPTGWRACSARDAERMPAWSGAPALRIHLRCSDRQATRTFEYIGFS